MFVESAFITREFREEQIPVLEGVITKTAKGAYMVKGHDGKGNKLTTLVNAEKALNYLRSPYVLNQVSTTGGTVYSTSSSYGQTFLAAHPGLASGNYVVKRREVRKTVTF